MKVFRFALLGCSIALAACGGGGNDSSSALQFVQSGYALTVNEDSSISTTVSVLDARGSTSFSLANAAANGNVDVDSQTGEISYQPDANFNGEDSFQVAASDQANTVTTNVSVTIIPINDEPVISTDTILITGGETKQGQIIATDVDGDVLTYAIAQLPNNGQLELNAATGEISYTPNELVIVDDQFSVSVTDTQGAEVTATVPLKANTASNTDRAYYYFASEHSHLKRAAALREQLNDDINISLLNQQLAEGYAAAGLTSQVAQLLAADSILADNIRANAMVNVATRYDTLGFSAEADSLRADANAIYNQYVAAKGLAAFSPDDVVFYKNLAFSYLGAGNNEAATEAFSVLDLLFTSLAEDGYSTSILQVYFAFRDLTFITVEQWQSSQDQQVYALSLDMVARLYAYANQIPAQAVSNNFNGNQGELFYSIRVVGLLDVVSAYIQLNQFDLAKAAMADGLALYGVINYDQAHAREADPQAAITKQEYEFGIVDATPHFVNLYPDSSIDPLLLALPEDSFWHFILPSDAEDAWLMAQVRNLQDKSAALDLILAEKDETDLRNHFTNLVAFNRTKPGAARILRQLGEFDAALPYLQEALNTVTSDAYLAQNGFVIFTLGNSGCGMVVNEALAIHAVTGQADALDLAQSAVNTCADVAQNYFGAVNPTNFVFEEDVIEANAAMLRYADEVDLSEKEATLIATVDAQIESLVGDNQAVMDANRNIGEELMRGGNLSLALNYYESAIVALNAIEAEAVPEEVGIETTDFFDGDNSESDYVELLQVIAEAAGTHDEYVSVLAAARAAWKAVVDTRVAALNDTGVFQQASILPIYAEQLLSLDEYDAALALAQDEALGAVETQSIVTETASALASQDLFINSDTASVDTDLDGMPNFFLPFASEEQIAASGLTLDDDSDNDGTVDGEDSSPLDPTQQ